MGSIGQYCREKLFIGIFFHEKCYFEKVCRLLEQRFGNIDYVSDEIDFSYFSGYYDQEMGGKVLRIFVSFETLIDPSALAEIKCWTNQQEELLSNSCGRRQVNLDPGLISLCHIILATTKSSGHRIAIGCGIYAELTLLYTKGTYQIFAWTYPDFSSEKVQSILYDMRHIYKQQRKHAN